MREELGLADNKDDTTVQSINIVENTHYITSEFSLGTLQIFTSNQDVVSLKPTLAGGLQSLGEYLDGSTWRPGLATLKIISEPGFYQPLFDRTEQLCSGLREAAATAGVPFTTNHAGTMFGGFFTEEKQVSNYAGVMACNGPAFNQFFHRMLELGVYLAPASYEAGFMSSAHSEQDIADTVAAAATAMSGL